MMKKIVFLFVIGLLTVALQGAWGNDESQKDSKTARQERKYQL